MTALATTLYLASHFVQPPGARRRRRASFEPEAWELGAKLRAMQLETGVLDSGADAAHTARSDFSRISDCSLSAVAADHLAALEARPSAE